MAIYGKQTELRETKRPTQEDPGGVTHLFIVTGGHVPYVHADSSCPLQLALLLCDHCPLGTVFTVGIITPLG